MNIERTQHIGHYGVTFIVIRFTVVPESRHALANLCLLEAKTSARQVRDQIRSLYEKMLARDLPCEIAVAISQPLRRSQADRLNDQTVLIKQIISSSHICVQSDDDVTCVIPAKLAGNRIAN